jgi:hypothetical protein
MPSEKTFGTIPIERLSSKEKERTLKWEKNYETLRKLDLEEVSSLYRLYQKKIVLTVNTKCPTLCRNTKKMMV